MATAKKRIPKTKDELKAQMAHLQKIEKQKKLARLVFPLVASQKTIYDAQTVVNAAAGFIKAALAEKMTDFKVKDIEFDLSKEKDSPIKDGVLNVLALLHEENADAVTALLERFGNGLGQYASSEFMKNPMSKVKMEDFIA